MRVRDATEEDWSAIWSFLRDVLAAGETYAAPTGWDSASARAWWFAPPPGRVVVATENSTIQATARLVPDQLGAGDHVANASFVVDPAHVGQGIGRRLAEAVLDLARAEGYRAMRFNAVVETNTGAVALWRSLGFDIIGTVPKSFRHPVHGEVGTHVMHREL